jgi:single-strand DNA-binding protein
MSYSSTNRVVLVGRLTRDPELRGLPSGHSVCALRIAVNGVRKDAEGDYRERPNYFNVSVFGPHGENIHRYLHKGSRVAIDGRLEWSEWETAEQQHREGVRIVADSVEFLDTPGGGARDGEGDGDLDGSAEERELVGAGVGGEDLAF